MLVQPHDVRRYVDSILDLVDFVIKTGPFIPRFIIGFIGVYKGVHKTVLGFCRCRVFAGIFVLINIIGIEVSPDQVGNGGI
jgi:hypothetical protein